MRAAVSEEHVAAGAPVPMEEDLALGGGDVHHLQQAHGVVVGEGRAQDDAG